MSHTMRSEHCVLYIVCVNVVLLHPNWLQQRRVVVEGNETSLFWQCSEQCYGICMGFDVFRVQGNARTIENVCGDITYQDCDGLN